MKTFRKINSDIRYLKQKAYFSNEYSSKELPFWSVNKPHKKIIAYLMYALTGNKNPNVLDIGCGLGDYLLFCSRFSKGEVIGIDYISKPLIKIQKKSQLKSLANIKLINVDFWDYYPNIKFDIIIDSGFFHHVKSIHWKAYLEKIKLLGKENHFLILSLFSSNNYLYRGKNCHRKWTIHEGCYDYYFTYNEIISLFNNYRRILFDLSNKNKKNELLNFLLKAKND